MVYIKYLILTSFTIIANAKTLGRAVEMERELGDGVEAGEDGRGCVAESG